jgi:hypothetical protein
MENNREFRRRNGTRDVRRWGSIMKSMPEET